MAARKKIVPPVTPRIVHTKPGQRLFRYVVLVGAVLLTAWFSYDYGRTQAPAEGERPFTSSAESEQRITELERERDELRQKVADLEKEVARSRQNVEAARARIRALQQTGSSQPETPAAEPETAAVAPDTADNALKLENVHIIQMESANMFRIGFSVMHAGDSSGRVTGAIWIAVNGMSDGKPKRLSFKMLSPDGRSHVKMGFDQQQDVAEDVTLPENFHPKNILIEAKPYGDKYTGAAEKFAWDATG